MNGFSFHIPSVETDRLLLRAPQLSDLPAVTAFYASDRSHIVGGPHDARGSARSLQACIGHWALRGYGIWYIADKTTDRMLGWTGIINMPGWAEPELGWTVFQEAEGRGIAFEAAAAARAFAARHLDLPAPISYIAPVNTRSIALAERLGARFERDGELLGHACRIYRHPAPEVA